MQNKERDIIVRQVMLLEASLRQTTEMVARLREKLQPVSTGGSKKRNGLNSVQKTSLAVNRRKKLMRQAS